MHMRNMKQGMLVSGGDWFGLLESWNHDDAFVRRYSQASGQFETAAAPTDRNTLTRIKISRTVHVKDDGQPHDDDTPAPDSDFEVKP